MKTSTYLIRATRVLVLGAVLAGTTASAATAQTGCPCNRDLPFAQAYQQNRPAASFSTPQGLRADGLRQQGIASVYESLRAQANAPTPLGMKADGLRLQGIAKVYQQNHLGQAAATSSVGRSTGFDWADYAIGIGSGMGLILALVGGLAIGWQRRHRVQTA